MKVVEIRNNVVMCVYEQYASLEEAKAYYSSDIHLEEAPNDVFESWIFHPELSGESRFSRPPIPEGWVWDESGPFPYDPEARRRDERKALHSETTDDTMEAYRKLRQGDQTIDWQAWLDALDAYNVAIEETQNQPDYPNRVEYPEYPAKPTPQP